MRTATRPFLRALSLAAVVAFTLPLAGCGINNIPTYEQSAKAAWSEVLNTYKSRSDLIPNLVETVKGFAEQERKVMTDVVEAQVRVTVPLLSSALAGLVAVLLTAWFAPAVGLVLAGLMVAISAACWLAWVLESRSRDELLESRAEVLRISEDEESLGLDLTQHGESAYND